MNFRHACLRMKTKRRYRYRRGTADDSKILDMRRYDEKMERNRCEKREKVNNKDKKTPV